MADASKIYSHDVEANIDERIVKPLIDMNFDVVDGKYPQFRFKALTGKRSRRSSILTSTELTARRSPRVVRMKISSANA